MGPIHLVWGHVLMSFCSSVVQQALLQPVRVCAACPFSCPMATMQCQTGTAAIGGTPPEKEREIETHKPDDRKKEQNKKV